jgi:hypothetical protein
MKQLLLIFGFFCCGHVPQGLLVRVLNGPH